METRVKVTHLVSLYNKGVEQIEKAIFGKHPHQKQRPPAMREAGGGGEWGKDELRDEEGG